MYKLFIRPLLFQFSPETIHKYIVFLLKFSLNFPPIKSLIKSIYCLSDKKLERELFGIKFKNPVGLAAGFDKDGKLINELDALGFGFLEIGTVTPVGQPGNPRPRLFRIPADKALINRMGFNNDGVQKLKERLKNRKTKLIIGGNIGKNTTTNNLNAVDDYLLCFKELYDYVDYFVINVSCPNITDLTKLQDADLLEGILKAITVYRADMKVYKPVLLKISPDLNLAQVDMSVDLVTQYKIDGIIASNTSLSRVNLKTNISTLEQIGNGGLSGTPLKDRSTELIRYINSKTNGKLPIIGVGGIFTPEDAIEKLKAGASLIQVYTGFIYEGPATVKKINKRILKELY